MENEERERAQREPHSSYTNLVLSEQAEVRQPKFDTLARKKSFALGSHHVRGANCEDLGRLGLLVLPPCLLGLAAPGPSASVCVSGPREVRAVLTRKGSRRSRLLGRPRGASWLTR